MQQISIQIFICLAHSNNSSVKSQFLDGEMRHSSSVLADFTTVEAIAEGHNQVSCFKEQQQKKLLSFIYLI